MKKNVIIELTGSASRHSIETGLTAAVDDLLLGADCAVGDLVTISNGGVEATFTVIRRRWIADGKTRLCLTLDHPAAPGR